MTKPNTVIVLGAGASADYGFPLGRGLRDDVCRMCKNPTPALCRITGCESSEFIGFGERLAESGYTSVDWYLEVNPNDMKVGKCAIAAALAGYEKPESLFPGPNDHWYEVLVNSWWTDANDMSGGRHVTFLTFNYDRSLEHYLATVARRRIGAELREVTEVAAGSANEIVVAGGPRLIHLHGQLNGPYSATWSSERLETNSLLLLSAANDDSVEFVRGRELVAACDVLYFLGFGFNPKSVNRLGTFQDPAFVKDRQISGTHGGFTLPAWERTRRELFPHGWRDLKGWGAVADFVRHNEL